MKHIYVSPHADDVALSCGGQILANPARDSDTMVLTVFTSDARDGAAEAGPHAGAFAEAINSSRHAEDRAAWASVGVRVETLALPEALLRGEFPFVIMGAGRDDPLAQQLCDALRPWIARYPDALFHFPAAFGNHVDHRACRAAAFRLLGDGTLAGLRLYEDAPYGWLRFIRRSWYRILLRDVAMAEADLAQALRPDGIGLMAYWRGKDVPFPRGRRLFTAVWVGNVLEGLRPASARKPFRGRLIRHRLDREVTDRKSALIGAYRSQVAMLFGNHPNQFVECRGALLGAEYAIELVTNARQPV